MFDELEARYPALGGNSQAQLDRSRLDLENGGHSALSPGSFMRGGTSKAVIFRADDLPRIDRLGLIFLAVMGSPDKYRRQLDGMGGGISSLSKVCIVGKSTRSDADIDYTFAQVSVIDLV